MLLGGQEEQCPQYMLLCNHNFLLFLVLVVSLSLLTAQPCFKRDVSYILGRFLSSAPGSVFLQNIVNHMTRNGNSSFSLLHISIRNLSPLLCRNFSFEGQPWHPPAGSNIHLAGLSGSTSAVFDSLVSFFFLRKKFFFFFFYFASVHCVFK